MAQDSESDKSSSELYDLPFIPDPPASEVEANCYYAGLPSRPRLIARTDTTPWKFPDGPEAYLKCKDLRPVGNHASRLKTVWEHGLALGLRTLLDSKGVKWTSTDVVRIGYVGELAAPVVLWIGVMPDTLSADAGIVVALECQNLLMEYSIADVDVEIRESIVAPTLGPRLLAPSTRTLSDPTVDLREPLTHALGLPISMQLTPWVEGTGGFFVQVREGDITKTLLVTARHVVFPPDTFPENRHFTHKADCEHSHNVLLFGNKGFEHYLQFLKSAIVKKEDRVRWLETHITMCEGAERELSQDRLIEEKEALIELNTFYRDISGRWTTPESRILGHVLLSPPIDTEDWAVIEIDPSKIDPTNFPDNMIDLGTSHSRYKWNRLMHANLQSTSACYFTYPLDRLLRLSGTTIPDEEMRYPTARDEHDQPCLMVIKRGSGSGLTVGRANDVFSYIRRYSYDGSQVDTCKEWAILPGPMNSTTSDTF